MSNIKISICITAYLAGEGGEWGFELPFEDCKRKNILLFLDFDCFYNKIYCYSFKKANKVKQIQI